MEYIEDIKDQFDQVDPNRPVETQPLDPEKFSAFVKNG